MATSIAWTSTQHRPLAQGPATARDPRGTPVRPPTPPYQHAGAEEEAVDGLGDVGGVDLVVVRVSVLPVAGLQRIQQRCQEDGGDLRYGHTRSRMHSRVQSHWNVPGTRPRRGHGHGRTLKRLLRLCRVKSSKTMVLRE